jgi:hypothetical protein
MKINSRTKEMGRFIGFTKEQGGMASIPTVVVLMLLIVSVGALVASISISDTVSVSETNNSGRALNYAQLGAKDALQRIVRNKDYTGSYEIEMVSGGCVMPYSACATMTVDSGSSPKIINAEGRVKDIKRKIQVEVNLDNNGLITSYDWQEF